MLPNEIANFLNDINPSPQITTLYVGGGTPSSVPIPILDNALKNILRTLTDFPEEITIEVNPSDVCDDLLKVLKETGVNRVSMGAQSFDNDVLRFLERRHTRNDIIEAFKLLRKNGFENLSMDLIHGVFRFDIKRWLSDLKEVVRLNPEHISLYALSVEEGSRFYEKGYAVKLNPDTAADEYNAAVQALRESGYERYEISNFAKPGYECRHNLAYWNTRNYAGFGPSSAGYYDGAYTERVTDIEKYISLLDESKSTIERTTHYDKHDQFVNSLIMGLRLESGVDLNTLKMRFDVDAESFVRDRLDEFLRDEYVILNSGNLRLADKGFYVSNIILSRLF